MKNKHSQAGSAHLIIIIILAIALIGALGFVFWQNVIQKKTDVQDRVVTTKTEPTAPATIAKQEIALSEIAADNTLGTNLALKYPNTWTMAHETTGKIAGDNLASEIYNITSPDSKVIVNFIVSNGGFGGMCEKTAGDEIIEINAEEIPNYNAARFVSYYGSTYFFAGTQTNSELIRAAKVGDSICNLGIPGFISPVKNSLGVSNMSTRVTINFTDIKDSSASSIEKFKLAIKTDNFTTAKNIVKSLYVK